MTIMQLNEVKEAALLSWINSVYPEEPLTKIIQMIDGHRLLQFAYRVQGKDFCDGLLVSPSPNVMEMIFSMLQADFQFSSRQAFLMLWKISQGVDLELQLAKVILVLCYCGFKTYNMVPLDTKTGLMIASMFHFVEDDADGLSLDEGLDRFLTKASVMTFSTSSSENSCCSPSYTDDESLIFSQGRNPRRVQFQEHFTVSCSSVSSPVQEVISTPQLLKRLRKELAREGDLRDELKKELNNQIGINLEKEGVISQFQHRVERMLREQGELEEEHKAALLELQEKNERVHQVVKQCQDLKTENTEKKKMIDVLTKENQTFASQISLKGEEISNLRNKYDTLDHELKLVREQNIDLKEVIKSNCREHEDTVNKLQQELDSASVASEKEEMLGLSAELTSLKEQICRYSENEVKKQQERSVLEAQNSVLKEKCTSLQNQMAEVKESELKLELCHQTMLRVKAQELERTVREHHIEISALASERDTQINSLKAEMKNQHLRSERLRAQLELKVEKQNGSILALKNMARQWEQQNEELLEKLKIMFTQLQHYSGKNKEAWEMNKSLVNSLQANRREVEDLQMEREQAEAKVKSLEARLDSAERHLQELRKMTDDTEDVRCRETPQDTSSDRLNFELNDSFNANAQDVSGIGVEDKPEHAADDWMRVAELQARNKACLPHMKSSYPLESRPTVGLPSFTLTDEDLRMGDPKESMRRAALHLHESQTLRPPGSLLHDLNTPEQQYIGTGEAKKLASCISRTMMLKSRHANRLTNAELKGRQSVMFTIVNTPKHQRGSLLQRGLKRRKEACKSPTAASRALQPAKSTANSRSPLSLRKCPRNKSQKKGEQEN
ncbi:nuclear mitotic apparatus protein 1 [Carassius auratus]|uniref:Nuclear mitotic apparatus protein 1 n=1 Tax=Carassius auratus TaxID=7957 RepID=A0A6P6QVS4_CARAU|nr:nuclear mitotic apparatus protein 1-like [Carassius auratus]